MEKRRKGSGMGKKKWLLAISIVFYFGMALLALFAEKIHMASLPRVRIGYLEQRVFTVGESQSFFSALPREFCETELYYLSEEEKNGEIRYIARALDEVVLGEEEEGYCPVIKGMSSLWPLITEGAEELTEGQEVFVENEEDLKSWY